MSWVACRVDLGELQDTLVVPDTDDAGSTWTQTWDLPPERLHAAGFDEATKAALAAEQALCGVESPVNVLRRSHLPGNDHQPVPGLAWR